jgi:hypothetical protein
MNDLRSLRSGRLSDDYLDKVLRTFFRAEIPNPWPAMKAPEPLRLRTVRRPWWKRTTGLTLAASVGLLLVGYLGLASSFPKFQEHRDEGPQPLRQIGDRPVRTHTLGGRKALIWEKRNKDGGVTIKIIEDGEGNR